MSHDEFDQKIMVASADDHVRDDLTQPLLQDRGVETKFSSWMTFPPVVVVLEFELRKHKFKTALKHFLRELV